MGKPRKLRDAFVGASRKEIKFKKIHSEAIIPTKSTKESAGFDFYSTQEALVQPWGKCLIDTGIAIANLPNNSFLKLESRSGLCWHHNIIICGGVIDKDFQSSIKAILFNLSSEPYQVKIGDKICQGVFLKTLGGKVQSVRILSKKQRGSKGFGSSDKK